jgi:hypothetical protein
MSYSENLYIAVVEFTNFETSIYSILKHALLRMVNIMQTKSDKKKRNDNKGKNSKTANPITMDTDNNMHKPVRGLPNK